MADRLTKENAMQKRAFELYYGLGDKRSLRAVAETIGKSERTVAGWSRSFNWVARITQRNIEISKNKQDEAINTQLTDVRTRYRVVINNLMAELSQRVAKGEFIVKNITEFEKLVKLDLLLMGEATERTEVSGGVADLSQDAKSKIDELYALMKDIK